MITTSTIKLIGSLERIIEYKDGSTEVMKCENAVLDKGREALTNTLTNLVGNTNEFFVARMIFGDGGTTAGAKKFVNTNRNGLFGVTRLTKPVTAMIDDLNTTQAIFTSVILFEEINSTTINEMALQMQNNDLYSMITFPDLNKTSEMQITWNWRLNFV